MLKCWKRHLNKCRQKIQHQQQQLLQRYTQALKTEGCGDEHNQAPEGQNQSKVTYYYQYLIAVESETDIWPIWAWINERYGQAWSSVCFCLCHLENNWAKWSRPNTLCEVCRTGWGWCYTREDIAKNAVTSKPWMSWHSQWSRLHKTCKLIRSALKTLRENRSQFSGLKGLESRVRLLSHLWRISHTRKTTIATTHLWTLNTLVQIFPSMLYFLSSSDINNLSKQSSHFKRMPLSLLNKAESI